MLPSNKKINNLFYTIDFNNELKMGFDDGLSLYPDGWNGPWLKDYSLIKTINTKDIKNVNFDEANKIINDSKSITNTIENIGSWIGNAFKNAGSGLGSGVEWLSWKVGGGIHDVFKGGADGLKEVVYNPIFIGLAIIARLYLFKSNQK